MILRSPENNVNPRSWIKALLLSPGMLFLFGYLGIYSAASIMMNGPFRELLQQRYPGSSGNTHTLTIGSIEPEFSMNAITLSRIEMTPTEKCPKNLRRHISVKKLALGFPELEKTLFSSRKLRESTALVCRKIREVEIADQ